MRLHKCFLCGESVDAQKRHTIHKHLPWYASPDTACLKCHRQLVQKNLLNIHIKKEHGEEVGCEFNIDVHADMWVDLLNGLFREISRTMGVNYPAGLEFKIDEYMKEEREPIQRNTKSGQPGFFNYASDFSQFEKTLVDYFNEYNDFKTAEGTQIDKPHFKIASLINWKILKVLISKLSPDQLVFQNEKMFMVCRLEI